MEEDDKTITHKLQIPLDLAGKRLDVALHHCLPDYSRTRLQQWIKQGRVSINKRTAKAREKVLGLESIIVQAQFEQDEHWLPQPMELNIVHADEAVLIVDKPAGLVVHPGAGIQTGTLLNGLLAYDEHQEQVPRAGIVHRLDKDTSGLMIVARTLGAHQTLVKALEQRTISRHYQAIARGTITAGCTIEAPIGRHPKKRTHMAIVHSGKPATTHVSVLKRYTGYTHLALALETGRTHQIRVHLAHIGHPIVGDPTYGGRLKLPKGAQPTLIEALQNCQQQCLHACELSFAHPTTGQHLQFHSPLPTRFTNMLTLIKEYSHGSSHTA